VAVNNIDVSADYISKLKGEIEAYVGEAFSTPADRVSSCLLLSLHTCCCEDEPAAGW
jgi:hypothetical protein